jgi:nucleotide-binding universal stress UspA family protein
MLSSTGVSGDDHMSRSSLTPVVAGVSGSPASRAAVEAAAEEAAARELPLRLVHTLTYRMDVVDQPRSAEVHLRQARAIAGSVAPGLRTTTELLEGDPVPGLLRLSRRAALTVIGDGDLNEWVCLPREATAVQVAARAFGSVLVVRATSAPDGPVLVGVNGSAASAPVLEFAFETAARRHARLQVVHVGEVPRHLRVIEDVIRSQARGYGVDLCFDVLAGDPVTTLRHEAQRASLVVVGARGELPYHGLLGSVAQTVLHHSGGPVAIIRRRVTPVPRPAVGALR